jgi:hypothetical protein
MRTHNSGQIIPKDDRDAFFGTSLRSHGSIAAVTIQMIPRMIVMPFGTSLRSHSPIAAVTIQMIPKDDRDAFWYIPWTPYFFGCNG